MAGYTRQSSSSIVNGSDITAAPLNAEFNQVLAGFNNTTGHKHDGTAAEGPVIGLIGDPGVATPLNKVVVDNTNNRVGVFVDASGAGSTVEQVRIQDGAIVPVTDNDIDLGTSSVEFKDLYLDGTAHVDTLDVDANATVAGTLGVTGNSTLSGNLVVTGNATLGNAASDTVTVTADVASPLIPSADDTYDLGATGSEWRNLYIDGTANIDTLAVDANGTVAGTLTITGATAMNGGLAMDTNKFTVADTSGNVATAGTLTVTGATALNGGLTMDTNKFTVADTSGSVATAGTLSVTGTSAFTGAVTADGGISVDNITIDGTEIDLSSGDLTLDVAGDIILNADGGDISLQDGSATFGSLTNSGGNLVLKSGTTLAATFSGANIDLAGTLDVTGAATLDSTLAVAGVLSPATHVDMPDNAKIKLGTDDDVTLYHDDSNGYITNSKGALKIATESSGIAVTIGHTTSEVTVGDNLTVTGNLTVGGTQTVVDTVTMNAANAIVFEGATADDHETTLTIVDPTADRTINLPNQSGTVPVLAAASNDQVTATPAELSIMDGDTSAVSTTLADADRVVVNDAGTMKQVALTDFETYMETSLDTLSNVTTVGALNAGSITSGFGAIDNGSSAITTTGTMTFGTLSDGSINITAFVDEDDMSSNSATLVPTQQSVKAYVDTVSGTSNNVTGLNASGAEINTVADFSAVSVDTSTAIANNDALLVFDNGNEIGYRDVDLLDTYFSGTTKTLTNKTLTSPIVTGMHLNDSGFTVEGSGADGNETTVAFVNPTADRTITFPNATGTVAMAGDVLPLSGGTMTGNLVVNGTVYNNFQRSNFITNGNYYDGVNWEWVWGNVDTNIDVWYKVADVVWPTDSLYTGGGFLIELVTNQGNWGSSTEVGSNHYNLAIAVSEGTSGSPDQAVFTGTDAENFELRAVKTAAGVYELQIKCTQNYRFAMLKVQVTATDELTLTPTTSLVAGSTSGTAYLPAESGLSTRLSHRFQRVEAATLALGDNNKATFGDGDDLQIYHDGSNSFIDEQGDGSLIIKATDLALRSSTGTNYLEATNGGAVTLYHNNAAKLATTSTGIDVTGNVIATGTVEPAGDTAAGDNAAVGYTAAEGLILTGQGSTSDITFKNDADAAVFNIPTGTTTLNVTGTVQADQYNNDEALPDIRPSLLLDFANSKTLDPRITFTRGSTATYWDGKTTAKAEENLTTYSQALNTWGKVSTSVTNDTVAAPDGTTTAETITAQAGTQQCRLSQASKTVVSSSDYTFSFYVKSNTETVVQLAFGNFAVAGDQVYANYNLSSGALGTVGTGATATITDVGNSWYRLTLSGQFTSSGSTGEILLSLCKGDASAGRLPTKTFDGTESIYAWGAQFEQRSSATAYTATTTSPIVKYQPVLQTAASGAARFDHNPVTGESKGLLIEEARTNINTTSEQVGAGYNTTTNVSALDNYGIAPDGAQTADLLVEDTATGFHQIVPSYAGPTSGETWTSSVFVKRGNGSRHFALRLRDSSGTVVVDDNNAFVYFDLSTGTVSSSSDVGDVTLVGSNIEDAGNGWYRCSISGYISNLVASYMVNNFMTTSAGSGNSYAGDGFSSMLVWGMQMEEGSFPTSYIPTSGSTVTRAIDSADVTGTNFSQWFNPTEGTILTDFEYNYNESGSGYPRIWSITEDGDIQHRMGVLVNETANGLTQELYSFNVNQVSIAYQLSNLTGSATAKSSFAYAEDNFGVSANGSLGTDTSGTVATSPPRTSMRLGGLTSSSGEHRQTWIKKWAFYPKRLSNATLQAMTEA